MENCAIFISQSRHDPRLAEVMTEHIRNNWFECNPIVLNQELKKSDYANTILVMIEQIMTMCEFPNKETKEEFNQWANQVRIEISFPLVREHFFINLSKENGYYYNLIIKESIASYLKFNFYGHGILFNKQIPKSVKSRT